MHHHKLREVAKLFAGLVAGDFLAVIWLWSTGLHVSFLGVTLTESMYAPALVFDAALFVILVHYGWHMGKTPLLRERSYLMIAGFVFGAVAVAHLVRVFTGVDLQIAGWYAPIWLSWVGVAATAYLSYMSFRLAMRMR